jgi:hypothetical protein
VTEKSTDEYLARWTLQPKQAVTSALVRTSNLAKLVLVFSTCWLSPWTLLALQWYEMMASLYWEYRHLQATAGLLSRLLRSGDRCAAGTRSKRCPSARRRGGHKGDRGIVLDGCAWDKQVRGAGIAIGYCKSAFRAPREVAWQAAKPVTSVQRASPSLSWYKKNGIRTYG